MVLVQKWPVFQLFFLGNIGQENGSYEILERKNACLGYKNKKFKKRKIDILTIVFYDILERKNAFLGYKKKKLKKLKNWDFPKGFSPWFWSKIVNFSMF